MSMETDLIALLKSVCARTFPDVAPPGTAKPYVTWQGVGGKPVNYTDNTVPTIRNAAIQISVWSNARLEANAIAQQIEDAIRTSETLSGRPISQPMATYEDDTKLYGAIQRFDIWADR